MSTLRKSSPIATRMCCNCNDGKLYTADTLYSHHVAEHQEKIFVVLSKRFLCFKRRRTDRLFPCACGMVLKASRIRDHASICAACKVIVANARGTEPVEVAAQSVDGIAGADSQHGLASHPPKQGGEVLLEPEELRPARFVIYRELNIVLCKACKTMVNPRYVREHLRKDDHASALTPDVISAVNGYIRSQGYLLAAEDLTNLNAKLLVKQKAGPALPQIPILPLYANGFKCTHCGSASICKGTAKKHIRGYPCCTANAKILSNISLQRLSSGDKMNKWLHVDTSNSGPNRQTTCADSSTSTNPGGTMSSGFKRKRKQPHPHWIAELQWNTLAAMLRQSPCQSHIKEAVNVPHESASAKVWLISMFVETVFEMERREISERDRVHRGLQKVRKNVDDAGLEALKAWQNKISNKGRDEFIMAAVRMIYALAHLNKSRIHSGFLLQSDELHQAALKLSQLLGRIIEYATSGSDDEMGYVNELDDEDHFTALLYVIRIMRLLWISMLSDEASGACGFTVYRLLFLVCWKEDAQPDPVEVRSAIDHFEHWACITVDIHTQLQLSAWKAHSDARGDLHRLDQGHPKLLTNLWWDVLDASQEGREELHQYLKQTARKGPVKIIEQTHLYIEGGSPTPFDALRSARDVIDEEQACARQPSANEHA